MIAAVTIDLAGIAGVLTALGVLAGSQGVVAFVTRRQLRSDVGDTGTSTLVDRFDSLESRMTNIEHELSELRRTGPRSGE